MAERIEAFDVTIPLGTAVATPQTTALLFDIGVVQRVEILVPPGPSGLVGFQLVHSGQVIIPDNPARFIVADGEVIKWDLEGYPVGRAWALRAYNTDVFDHTIYLRFLVAETRRNILAPAQLVPIAPGGLALDLT